MKNKKLGLRVAGTIFAVVALLHLARVLFGIQLVIGTMHVPYRASVWAFVVSAGLSGWMWWLSKTP